VEVTECVKHTSLVRVALKKFYSTDRVFLGVDDVDGGSAGKGSVAVGEGVRQVDGATET
jgi:hypothetical protein